MKHKYGPTEAEFLKSVIALANTFGWSCAHFPTAHIQRKDGSSFYATPVQGDGEGFPDLVVVKSGYPIYFIELKVGKGKPTARQENWLRLLDRGSSPALVIRPADWERLVKLLEPGEGKDG